MDARVTDLIESVEAGVEEGVGGLEVVEEGGLAGDQAFVSEEGLEAVVEAEGATPDETTEPVEAPVHEEQPAPEAPVETGGTDEGAPRAGDSASTGRDLFS